MVDKECCVWFLILTLRHKPQYKRSSCKNDHMAKVKVRSIFSVADLLESQCCSRLIVAVHLTVTDCAGFVLQTTFADGQTHAVQIVTGK